MTLYISLLEKDTPDNYKSLEIAWTLGKYRQVLQKFRDKGYNYIKLIGDINNPEKFIAVKPARIENGKNIGKITKDFIKGDKVYTFLLELYNKFIKIEYTNDIGYYWGNEEEYLSQRMKGLNMVKFDVKFHHNIYSIRLTKYSFDKLKFKINSPVPIKRDNKTNIICCDYDEIKRILKQFNST